MQPDFSGLMSKKPAPKKEDSRLKDIPIDLIDPDPKNVRKAFDKDELKALAATMKARGQLQPALVKQKEDDRYLLIAGERRWRAAKIAGLKTLLALEDDRKVEDQRAIDQLIENMQREDLRPSEIIQGMVEAKGEGLKAVEIAALSGLSKQMVGKYLKLSQSEEYIQLADEIGVRNAYERVLELTGDKRGGQGGASAQEPEGEADGEGTSSKAKRKPSAKVEPLACKTTSIEIDGKPYQLSRAWVVDDTGAERPVVFE